MIREWWTSREPRERTLLMVLAGLLALTIAYYGIWSPLQNARESARQAVNSAAADYSIVQRGLRSVSAARSSSVGAAENVDGFRSEITRTAREAGLSIARLQSGAGGSIQISFDDAEPQRLFAWLASLDGQPGGQVIGATLTNRDAATVQAVIELRGGRE